MGKIILITGGARCGKSSFAEDYVKTQILGHEITGVVVEMLQNVKTVKLGDRVVIEPLLYCNSCNMCKSGHIIFLCNQYRLFPKFMIIYL